MKKRADKRARSCQSNIKISDIVLVRQKKDKFNTKFDPAPYKVIEIKRSMVTAIRNDNNSKSLSLQTNTPLSKSS